MLITFGLDSPVAHNCYYNYTIATAPGLVS